MYLEMIILYVPTGTEKRSNDLFTKKQILGYVPKTLKFMHVDSIIILSSVYP